MTQEQTNPPLLAPLAGAKVLPDAPTHRLPERALAIIPVRNMVLFPGVLVPISIGRDSSIAAAQHALKAGLPVGIVYQKNPEVEAPQADDLSAMGTVASILRYVTTPDGTHHIICQGLQRFKVEAYLSGYPFTVARVEKIEEHDPVDDKEIEARSLRLKARATEVLKLLPHMPQEMLASLQAVEAPGLLTDLVAGYLDLKAFEKQALLEELDLQSRMDRVLDMLLRRLEVLEISRDIDKRTKESLGHREREFLLREQLKAIQKELGDDAGSQTSEIEEKIKAAHMPEEVAQQAQQTLKRLAHMADGSSEYAMTHTYLEWLVELPWHIGDQGAIDIAQAKAILDNEHFGLDKVKQRILEFLAVRKLNPQGHGPILCLVGPPGVGKTSLGQSIARSMGRKFVRVSLGGVHDEAEIRGHRRTYIGALPGSIIQALKKAGTRNCVMMLDEIDKLGTGIHGDPAAAMLEVLDPEQNHTFHDNYLGVPYDLSQVLFIATANVLDPIPSPLRDRMEVLHLAGYTQEEKREIARRYLVARQLEASGLQATQLTITDGAIAALIRDYTREAGVRHLERQLGSVCRHAAVRVAGGETQTIHVDAADLVGILGAAKFENELALRAGIAGVATGLAWTPVGGDILFIEASKTQGSGRLILTGQLGDVMKESAQAALTLVKSRADTLKMDPSWFEKTDIHIHVPAGAIPKDGPSAGVAMFVALSSLLMNQPIKSYVAMTGEISLRGMVLPVGGIKEKVLAALAAGITQVILPTRNKKDLEEVPLEAQQQLQFFFVDDVREAVTVAVQ